MKKIIKLLPFIAMTVSLSVNAEYLKYEEEEDAVEKTIKLEDNSKILGHWDLYAEVSELHKPLKKVVNKWEFREDGILVATAFDPRLDGEATVEVKYSVNNGVLNKQVQPGREYYEDCAVIKLDVENLTLHCKNLYYLLKKK